MSVLHSCYFVSFQQSLAVWDTQRYCLSTLASRVGLSSWCYCEWLCWRSSARAAYFSSLSLTFFDPALKLLLFSSSCSILYLSISILNLITWNSRIIRISKIRFICEFYSTNFQHLLIIWRAKFGEYLPYFSESLDFKRTLELFYSLRLDNYRVEGRMRPRAYF